MVIAIIVVTFLLLAGLIALFVVVQVKWHREYPKTLPNGELRPKQSAKEWFKNHIPSKRRLIQVYAALLYNANIKGFISGNIYGGEGTKYLCVPGMNCYSCPGAVGSCPLGALQNALSSSKTKAPYYMLGILALFGLIFARTVCGFLCPVGLGQDLLYKARTPKLKKSRVTRVLSYLKYILLGLLVIAIPLLDAMPGFCKYICPAGTLGGAVLLLSNPNNAGMFTSLGALFTWKFCVMVALIVASIFIYRVFCRFLCPLGAIYGFFNRIALLGVKLDEESCTECGLCISHCKMDVKRVGDHECINCGECISVCPTKAISWKGAKLFVHANAIPAPVEEKPLAVGEGVTQMTATAATGAADSHEMPVTVVQPQESTKDPAPQAPNKKSKRGKRFWLELAAWMAALGLLIGALAYYNFVDKDAVYTPPPDAETGYEVGQMAPDFTLELIGKEGTFNLYEQRGKVTIVNFWATWCGGCIEELPYFNQLSQAHPEWNIVAIHGPIAGDKPADYIAKHFSDWTLTFAQDLIEGTSSMTFLSFGGKSDWPMTVIIDEEGIVQYNSTTPFKTYQQLETTVLTALQSE